MNKALFEDKFIGYHTFGLLVDGINCENLSNSGDTNISKILYVDLGLPSGTLWATCNIGATSEEEIGLYFLWGDTLGYRSDLIGTGVNQKEFSNQDYKFGDPNHGYTKYNNTDNKSILETEDDAAKTYMGSLWSIPGLIEMYELMDECNYKVTTINDILGILFTAKSNSNTLFFPFGGIASSGSINDSNEIGFYWSSELTNSNLDGHTFVLSADEEPSTSNINRRYLGLNIRGIIRGNA